MPGTLAEVMDGLDTLCATVADNHYAYPVDTVTVPCTVVGYPERIDYDVAFGLDEFGTLVLPIWHIVGKTSTKDARDALSAVLSSTDSVKAAVDGAHDFGDVRATRAQASEITVNSVPYLAAKYDCEVI